MKIILSKEENRPWVDNFLCWLLHKWDKKHCKKCGLYMVSYP